MSDQILSQEEIDALLGAMAKGEVNLEADVVSQGPKVETYDLTYTGPYHRVSATPSSWRHHAQSCSNFSLH
jgi:hypothetical protein